MSAPRSLDDAISATDSSLIEDAKKYFDGLVANKQIPSRFGTAVSVIGVITDVVEYISTSVKNSGGKLSSQEKLNLAFSIGTYCVDSLLQRGIINQSLHDDIISKINTTQVFTDIVADIISLL